MNTLIVFSAMEPLALSGDAKLAEQLTAQHITNAKIHMMEGMKFNG